MLCKHLSYKSIKTFFRIEIMAASYTALIQRDGPWWIGWIEEIPGVNSQGATREELLENLQSALQEALELAHKPL
jgi:predicted RNase H-like HicB family nuclease